MSESNDLPTLEQIAQEFRAEERQPLQSGIPAAPQKPEDPEELVKWSAQRTEDLSKVVSDLAAKLTKKEQDEFASEQMKALENAVKSIKDNVPVSDLFIEGALHAKYVRDLNFRKIFDNRDQNPGAYKKALTIVADEIKKEASVKYDPQVAEDQKALNQLQRNARSGKTVEDKDEKWKNMSASDFDREWARLVGY